MPLFRNPTFAEVDELIAAKSAQLQALDTAAAATLTAWGQKDADAANAWREQWVALIGRFNAAVQLRSGKPTSLAPPPELVWNSIVRAVKQAWTLDGPATQAAPETPGDLSDLDRRLRAAGGSPDYSRVPQPVVPDADLAMFKAAGVVVTTAQLALDLWPMILIGALLGWLRRSR